jgi:superfamily II DNA/RNA helicase
VHRIGRTGRAGKEGRSLTLVTPDDAKQLKDIERMLGAPVTWIGDPPSAEDLAGGRRGRGRGRGRHNGAPQRLGDRQGRGRGAPSRNGAQARDGRQNGHATAEQPRVVHAEPPDPRQPQEARERGGPQRQARPPRTRPQSQQPREARSSQHAPAEPRKTAPRPRQPERKRQHRDGDHAPSPVGLGDHVPAFLRKTTRTTAR